jgi:hypothetical protein
MEVPKQVKINKDVILMSVDEILPYENNSKSHPEAQIETLVRSIEQFGFNVPVIIDENKVLIAGHGRLIAAKKIGMTLVPTITLYGLNEAKKRQYRIMDNKSAESEWLLDKLKLDFNWLDTNGYDLDLTGFSFDEISAINKEEVKKKEIISYSEKIVVPTYSITGEKPDLSALYSKIKTDSLISEIDRSKLDVQIKDFLKYSAYRHIVFDYSKIAEYYAHADKETQDLMEKSALVIIDFKKAIENGYTKFTGSILEEGETNEE